MKSIHNVRLILIAILYLVIAHVKIQFEINSQHDVASEIIDLLVIAHVKIQFEINSQLDKMIDLKLLLVIAHVKIQFEINSQLLLYYFK